VPYVVTRQGQHLVEFMKYLDKENLISDNKNLILPERSPEYSQFLTKIAQAGYDSQDFQNALACGLIHKGHKIVIVHKRYERGTAYLSSLLLIVLLLALAWILFNAMAPLIMQLLLWREGVLTTLWILIIVVVPLGFFSIRRIRRYRIN
jgi:hypothetical protein